MESFFYIIYKYCRAKGQYIKYLNALLHGDLGESMVVKSGDPVTQIIAEHFPVSLKLGLIALAIAVFLGIPLGVLAAVKHDSIFDRCFVFFASFFVSIPSFIMTVALMMVFGVWPVSYTHLDVYKRQHHQRHVETHGANGAHTARHRPGGRPGDLGQPNRLGLRQKPAGDSDF